MKIFAIGDLHLSTSIDKPMDIFGEIWDNHVDRLIKQWCSVIRSEDYVLIPGDISWAMKIDQAYSDLDLLEQLPGYKICIRGNHDYWWDRPAKLNGHYRTIYFLQNTSYQIGNISVCGSRAWHCPNATHFTQKDERIFHRECIRLKLSLEDAVKNNAREIILMQHYPPTFRTDRSSPFTDIFKQYPISHVVYGHLHDSVSWAESLQGNCEGINYHLVSADYLDFTPKIINVY